MKVLIIGSGGREHALTWKIAQSPMVDHIVCTPGNPGMGRYAECVDIPAHDVDGLVDLAKERDIALTVVGPEDPLANGIVDRFEAEGLTAFGPSAAAARLEASKAFAKHIMARYGIPTARHAEFGKAEDALAYVAEHGAPLVVKADGLAAGKGVTVAMTREEAEAAVRAAMVDRVFGDAGGRVILEERLVGEEASILALTDGDTVVPLATSQDHKAVYDGDAGPNTGGMGAYSPAPVVDAAMLEVIERTVLRSCVSGMAREGAVYRGCLYAGLMITSDGPKVIEFNCRFGDPETQVVLPRMKSDLVPVLLACCRGGLGNVALEWDSGACVSVVMASGGYPGSYKKGMLIHGIDDAEADPDVADNGVVVADNGVVVADNGVVVFHAGTKRTDAGLVTAGGRVLNVTARGADIRSAIDRAYRAVRRVTFEGAHFRTDIGQKALCHL